MRFHSQMASNQAAGENQRAFSAAIVTAAIHPCCLFHYSFSSLSHSWPQSKGQFAECPFPSRTHYTRLETEREQRSLCDPAGQRQTDMQDGEGGGERKFSLIRIKGIKSINEESLKEKEMSEVLPIKRAPEMSAERPLDKKFVM